MLPEALSVVEAARALDPYPGRAGIYVLSCPPRNIPARLRELSEALERFDRAVSRGNEAEALLGRAIRYAAARGIDPSEMMRHLSGDDPGAAIDNEDTADLVPLPGEVGEPDDLKDATVQRQAARDVNAVLGKKAQPSAKHAVADSFPGQARVAKERAGDTGRPLDASQAPRRQQEAPPSRPEETPPEPPSDMPVMKEVEDRIEALANRHGWSPELKDIDSTLRQAKDSMTKSSDVAGTAHFINALVGRTLGLVVREVGRLEAKAAAEDEPAPAFGMR